MIKPDIVKFEMFEFFEMTPDLVCIASKEGYFLQINQAVSAVLGYSKDELFKSPIASLIHPDDVENTRRTRTELLNGKTLENFENRYITKSGDIVWLHWTSIFIPDKQMVFAIAKDVTKRKVAEQEINEKYKQSRKLASHFKASLEKDKKYLAAELHEQLAQLAGTIKMDIGWLKENLSLKELNIDDRLDHASSVTQMLIDAIRKLSYSISPGMIEEMGLNESLNWLSDEFTKLNGIPCTFECLYDDTSLPHEVQLDLYRICQEALKNISEHADANTVKITLRPCGNKVCLSISDDGRGFDPAEIHQTPGIASIRERAASVNGELIVQSAKGNGTTVSVTIPPFNRDA